MKHWLYHINRTGETPAGSGTAGDWFDYYKWDIDDMVYVPVGSDYKDLPDPGDILWFSETTERELFARVFGAVEVVRLENDSLNDRMEVWYNGAACRRLPPPYLELCLSPKQYWRTDLVGATRDFAMSWDGLWGGTTALEP